MLEDFNSKINGWFTKENIIIILFVLLFISVVYIFHLRKEINVVTQKYKQNELALKDTLKIISDKNSILYHRYIILRSINDSLNSELKVRKEEIILLNDIIIKLKDINSSGNAIVYDTIKVKDCIGLEMNFQRQTDFYKYNLDVVVDNPPKHNLLLSFNPIVGVKNYITANKEGILSSYIEIPEKYKKYLQIQDLETIADEKFLETFQTVKKLGLRFFINGGISFLPRTRMSVGGGFIYNDNIVFYSKGVADNYHYINYGRIINF